MVKNIKLTALSFGIAALVSTSGCGPSADSKVSTSTGDTANAESKSTAARKAETPLPEFVLACSYGGGQPFYRLSSKGGKLLFASIVNENNMRSVKRSLNVAVEDRSISAKMKSADDSTEYNVFIDRVGLGVVLQYFVSRELYPPDGFSTLSYSCAAVDDSEIHDVLERYYQSTLAFEEEKRRKYEARPNKI